MDAKEAIEILRHVRMSAQDSIHMITNDKYLKAELVAEVEADTIAIEALEKAPALEVENARLEKYNNTLIADNNLLHNELVEIKHKMETFEAENARLREKETPKEPIMKEGNNRDLFCSICGARVSDVADRIINSDNLQKYCGVCGQKLDWLSDKE